MARTPLATSVEDAFRRLAEEDRTTRRGFLQRGAAVGVAVAGSSVFARGARAAAGAAAPRIVVVGGGLAGLVATYRLQQAGHAATLHEAANRLGGRCWTLRGAFTDGQIAERGGELIDTGHHELRRLARELGLKTVDILAAEAPRTNEGYYFDGAAYSHKDASRDFAAVYAKLQADSAAAGYPTVYTSYTQRGWELDHMSIADWIQESVPGGIVSKLGQLLDVAYRIEYGADTNVQSALNLVDLLVDSPKKRLAVFGASDERFRIVGGNDQVPTLLADAVDDRITTGSELVRVKQTPAGAYELTFDQGASTRTVTADHVVLALPFSILRNSVDFSRARFNDLKKRAIRELGMGTNAKLHLQFKSRFWEPLGSNGLTFADTGYQNTWDVTRGQSGDSGILVDYTSGTGFGGDPTRRARKFLSQLEPVLPGARDAWNGRVTLDYWPDYRWTKGSYSYWKVGQHTGFAGAEAKRSGNCHFAGEHTSVNFQGYLNGGVETGQRAAAEILAALA